MAFPSTFVDIQNNVINKLRLDSVNDLAKVKEWINQAYYQTCIESDFYEASTTGTTLVAGNTNVAVPSNIVKIEYIAPTGSDGTLWGPMDLVTLEEVLELRAWAGGTISTGAPSRYAYRSSSSDTIEFWPNAAGGETLNFYGSQLPTALSADTDTPIFPEPYATKVLEYGALVQAAEFKKDPLLADLNAVYIDWQQRLKAFMNQRIGAKTQQLRVERMRPFPHRNDTDIGLY